MRQIDAGDIVEPPVERVAEDLELVAELADGPASPVGAVGVAAERGAVELAGALEAGLDETEDVLEAGGFTELEGGDVGDDPLLLAIVVRRIDVGHVRPARALLVRERNQPLRIRFGMRGQVARVGTGSEHRIDRRREQEVERHECRRSQRQHIVDHAGQAVAIAVAIVGDKIVGQRVARPQAQAHPHVLAADLAEPLVAEQVALETVAALNLAGDAQRGNLAQREIERAFQMARVEVAKAANHIAAELVGRLGAGVQHRAAGSVAPEQRALRPFEHLDRAEIVKRGATHPADLDFVEVRQHRGPRA